MLKLRPETPVALHLSHSWFDKNHLTARGKITTWSAQHKPRKEKEMSILRDYQNWRKYRRTVNQLNSLSDTVLQDIGVERYAIDDYARKAARY